MKKTGQLIFTSKEGEDIVKRVGVSYIYYLEILSDRRCAFNINEEVIEATANKTLYIRTPVSSMVTITGGANLNILYETGDSTSFGNRALEQFVGSGSLPTESQTIVGAINEIYSTPSLGGGGSSSGGTGFRYPNEKTLLKINESSLTKWNGYETTISNNNRAINDLRNTDTQIKKDITNIQSLANKNEKNIEAIGKAILDTNQVVISSNQAIGAAQQELKQVTSVVDANSKNIGLLQTTFTDRLSQLSKENIAIRADIEKNSKELMNKAPMSRVEELESKVRAIEEMTSVEDEDFGVDPSKMIVESLITLRSDIDNNKKQVESLQKLTKELDEKYSSAVSNLTVDLNSKIKDNENLIKDNSKKVLDLSNITNTIIADIDKIVLEQSDTNSKLSDMNKSMSTVLNGLEKLERQIADINTTSSKVYEDLTAETGKNTLSIKNLAAELKRHMDEFENFKTKIQNQISNTADGLQAQIDQMKITDLEIRQELQRTGLESSQNKKDIMDIRTSQTKLSEEIGESKIEVDSLKQSQNNFEASFSKHLQDEENSHKEMQVEFENIKDDNRQQDENISKVAADLGQVSSNINFLADSVQKLGLDMSNKVDLSYKEEVEGKISALETEQLEIKDQTKKIGDAVATSNSEIDNLKIRVSLVEQNPGTSGPGEPSEGIITSLTNLNSKIDANMASIAGLSDKTDEVVKELKTKDLEIESVIQAVDSLAKQNTQAIDDTKQSLDLRIEDALDKIDRQNKINDNQDAFLFEVQDTFVAIDKTMQTKADKTEITRLDGDIKTKANISAITELDKKINTKADASELAIIEGKVATKADKSDISDLIAIVNSKIDKTALEPINEELNKKATVESVDSLKSDKADKSDIVRVEESIGKKADSVALDSLKLEVQQKATKQEVAAVDSNISTLSIKVDTVELSSNKAMEEVTSVKTSVSKNEVDISSLKSKIAILEATPPSEALTPEEAAELTNALNALSSKIDTTKKDIVDLNETKDRVRLELDAAKIERDQLSAKIMSLEDADAQIKEELFEHTTKLLNINTNIEYLTAEHNKIVSQVGVLETNVAEAEESISKILLDIKEMKADTQSIVEKISFVDSSISNLSEMASKLQTQVDGVSSLVITNKNTLDYLSTVVTNTANKISDIEATITTINKDIEGVKIRVTDLEGKISNVGAQGGSGGGSLTDIYESANVTNADRIFLKPGKIISVEQWRAGNARYLIVFPSSFTGPTQMGFSIYIPDNLSNDLSILYMQGSSAASIYWATNKPETLLRGKLYEFIFSYQSGKITGGYVAYGKK